MRKTINQKKSIISIIIISLIILALTIPQAKAKATSSTSLLNYTDVSIASEKGEKLKFLIRNQDDVQIDKIKIDGEEVKEKLVKDTATGYYYFYYTGNKTGVFLLEFYKKDAKTPFVTRYVEIMQDATTKIYSTNFAPKITYKESTANNRKFQITDGSKIKDIVIYQKNAKGDYDAGYTILKDGQLQTKNRPTYIETATLVSNKQAEITIKKLDEYGYYKIVVTDYSGKQLVHTREIKVAGVMATPKSAATAQNSFEPSVKVDKSKSDKIGFTINATERIKDLKVYAIINGVVQEKETSVQGMTKSGNYITGFTFAKEGMFRFVYTYDSSNETKYVTDYVFNKKVNTNTWGSNVTPRVYTKETTSDYRTMIIKDYNIQSIKIVKKEGTEYNNTIYEYVDGKETTKNGTYIKEAKTDGIETTIKVNRTTERGVYKIIVADKNGDIVLTRNKYINIDAKAEETDATTWLKICEQMAKKIDGKFTYKGSGAPSSYAKAISNKDYTCDCAHYVSWCLQEYGVLSSGQTFYSNSNGNLKYSSDNTKKNINNYASIIKVDKKIKNYYENLKPGDICCYGDPAHTNVYVGQNSNGELLWDDAGTSATYNKKSGSKFKTIENRIRSNFSKKSGDRVISKIIRIDFSKVK